MTTVRSIIQKLQAYNEDDKIEDLLDNSEFVQEIAESIKLLPKARTIISEIIVNQKLPTKKDTNRALKSIRKVTNIELPSEVLEKYRECQQYPLRFWSRAGIQLDLKADKTEPIELVFCKAYLRITQLETQRIWDTIIWRFFVLFFYDLVVILGRKILTESFENQLVGILSSATSIQDTAIKMRENLRRWVAAGSRYSQLSNSLGYGAPFLLPLSVADSTWEKKLPLKGPIYKSVVEHLESKSFREKSINLGADALGAEIRKAILKPFRWHLSTFKQNTHSNISKLYQGPTDTRESIGPRESELTGQPDEVFSSNEEGGIEAKSSTFGSNRSSINALLNPAEPTQSQQLSSVGSSSFAIGSKAGFSGFEQDSTAGEHAEFESSRKENRGLESQSQAEADGPPNKRRRVDSFPSIDLSLSQPSSGITYDRGVSKSPSSGDVSTTAVSQAEGARQIGPIEDVVGEHTTNGPIQATNNQREIEFVYSNPKKEKINSNLQEPFRSPVMARFQSGLGNHQQCIVAMFPHDWEQDVTFSFTIDRKAGYEMIGILDLQCLPQVQPSQGQVQQYSDMPKTDLHLLGDLFHHAIIHTSSYKLALGPRCACVSAFVADGTDNDDFTFSIMVDRDSGWELISIFGLNRIETGF